MLGRSVGLSEEKLGHLGDEVPPEGVYSPSEEAIVRYARKSTLEIAIDDETYGALKEHYAREQVMEIWALVGVANMINRFHATFHTDVDEEVSDAVEERPRRLRHRAPESPRHLLMNGAVLTRTLARASGLV